MSAPFSLLSQAAIEAALAEDGEDCTSAAFPSFSGQLRLASRQTGILAGVDVAADVFRVVGQYNLDITFLRQDGERVNAGDGVLIVEGDLHDLLRAERTALNYLCHLSGIATVTRSWVDAVAGTQAKIRDTRKTTPGLRSLEKYAVRCGGGENHRFSLHDVLLIKDNHVAMAGSVKRAIELVRTHAPHLPLEVEVDTYDQAMEALDAGVTCILLDNIDVDTMRRIVLRGQGATFEASGGLRLERAREVAETGVHYLAVGSLTHSAPVLDIGGDAQ